MKKRFFLLFLGITCFLVLPLQAQRQGQKFHPETFLPEQTLALSVFEEPGATLRAMAELLGYQRFRHRVGGDFELMLQQFFQEESFPLAVAFLQLSSDSDPTNAPLSPEWLLLMKVTEAGNRVSDFLETTLIPSIQHQAPAVEFGIQSVDGIEMYRIGTPQFSVYYLIRDHLFMMAQTPRVFFPVLARLQGRFHNTATDLPTLANASRYRRAVARLDREAEAWLYLDLRAAWHLFRPALQARCSFAPASQWEWRLALLDAFLPATVSWSVSFRDGDVYERLFVPHFPPLPAATASSGSSRQSSPSFPLAEENAPFYTVLLQDDQTVLYFTQRMNVTVAWQQILDRVEAMLATQDTKAVQTWLTRLQDRLSLDLKEELPALLSGEMAVVIYETTRTAPSSPSMPDGMPVLLAFHVTSAPRAALMLKEGLAAFRPGIQAETYWDAAMFSFKLPGGLTPVPVHTAVAQNFWLFSLSRTILRHAIVQIQRGSGVSLKASSVPLPQRGVSRGVFNLTTLLNSTQKLLNLPASPQQKTGAADVHWGTTRLQDGVLTESYSSHGGLLLSVGGWVWRVMLEEQ